MSVTDEWTALMRLLKASAPNTARSFLPGVSPDAVVSAEAATGLTWPDELREFFTCQGGQREYDSDAGDPFGGQILPAQDVFGLDQMLADRAMMIEVWQDIADGDPEYHRGGYDAVVAAHPDAGTEAEAFLPQYVPISGMDGYFYFCDLRPGALHGCVRAYYQDGADPAGYTWRSITDMVVGLRAAISDGSVVDMWEPRIENGEVFWQPEGGDAPPTPAVSPPGQVVVHTGYDVPDVSLSRPHDAPGADVDEIARAVGAEAARTYGAHRVSGAHTILRWLPQVPGFVVGCQAIVDGAIVHYAAVITDTPGEFLVVEVPPQGLRFER